MASPKVFISSTCYDLGQIRDSLSEFINSYFFDCLLSERGDVFYHPDLHTHESCVNEIENCHLFILVIGGRFGGSYKYDKTKSITNAEYEAAKIKKIPVFTFIKKDLLDDHRLYQKNKHNKKIIEQIEFPSIENQDYAVNIFEFINQVRLADVNNGLFPFEFVKDIKQYLGKQWAGMMFNFLSERSKNYDQKVVSNTLDNLTLISKKAEELIESLVRKIEPGTGNKKIEDLDKIINASKFYTLILRMYKIKGFSQSNAALGEIEPTGLKWYEYIEKFGDFILRKPTKQEKEDSKYKPILFLACKKSRYTWTVLSEDGEYTDSVSEAYQLYEKLLVFDKPERLRALEFTTSANIGIANSGA